MAAGEIAIRQPQVVQGFLVKSLLELRSLLSAVAFCFLTPAFIWISLNKLFALIRDSFLILGHSQPSVICIHSWAVSMVSRSMNP